MVKKNVHIKFEKLCKGVLFKYWITSVLWLKVINYIGKLNYKTLGLIKGEFCIKTFNFSPQFDWADINLPWLIQIYLHNWHKKLNN